MPGAPVLLAPRRNLRRGTENLKRRVHSPLGITRANPWGTARLVCTAWGYGCGYSGFRSRRPVSDLREWFSTAVEEKLLTKSVFT
jgi:hypothetical protein